MATLGAATGDDVLQRQRYQTFRCDCTIRRRADNRHTYSKEAAHVRANPAHGGTRDEAALLQVNADAASAAGQSNGMEQKIRSRGRSGCSRYATAYSHSTLCT